MIQKDLHPRSQKEDDNHFSASGSTHDEDRKYWLQSTEEYNDVVEVGPEVSIAIYGLSNKNLLGEAIKCRQIKI